MPQTDADELAGKIAKLLKDEANAAQPEGFKLPWAGTASDASPGTAPGIDPDLIQKVAAAIGVDARSRVAPGGLRWAI
jgi:hypothetical protein